VHKFILLICGLQLPVSPHSRGSYLVATAESYFPTALLRPSFILKH
jgi:hypothetical protein